MIWGVVLVLLVLDRASPARAAEEDSSRVNVLTFNVCASGNAAGTCTCDLTFARRKTWARQVADLVRSRDIDVASFTEMCYAQVSLLRRELPGYHIVWYGYAKGCGPGNTDRCRRLWGDLTDKTTPPDGLTFGVALLLKGKTEGPPLRRRLRVDHAPASKDEVIHPRGLLCARGMVGSRRTVSCVTHLSDTETPAQVCRLVASYAHGDPVILTGDFNRQPQDGQLTAVYGMGLGAGPYAEVDAAPYGVPRRGGEPTTRGGRKIDYIFASEDDYRPSGAQVVSTSPELSDHRALAGTFIGMPATPPNDGVPWQGSCRACERRRPGRRR
jgi:endonuclease/exonuclease/phosphatase family metal-dependent hydrolase